MTSLGEIAATSGPMEAFEIMDGYPARFIRRHVRGDWGNVCEDDAKENDFSVKNGFRIFSVYRLSDDTKIWIITEADRSATTVLLPSEY
jgi:hypothetical protein